MMSILAISTGAARVRQKKW